MNKKGDFTADFRQKTKKKKFQKNPLAMFQTGLDVGERVLGPNSGIRQTMGDSMILSLVEMVNSGRKIDVNAVITI